jgi:surface antigen
VPRKLQQHEFITMKIISNLFWLAAFLFLMQPLFATADPPDWAPAHGYRAKHKHHHDDDDDDYDHERPAVVSAADVGIVTGTCNRQVIGTVLGGVVGGAVGSKIGRDQGNQQVGLVLGAIIGAVVGQSIGKQMDDADKQCAVQVFEQARNGQTIAWTNPQMGVEYRLTPIETVQRTSGVCRKYMSSVRSGHRSEETQKMACRGADGTWRISTLN